MFNDPPDDQLEPDKSVPCTLNLLIDELYHTSPSETGDGLEVTTGIPASTDGGKDVKLAVEALAMLSAGIVPVNQSVPYTAPLPKMLFAIPLVSDPILLLCRC